MVIAPVGSRHHLPAFLLALVLGAPAPAAAQEAPPEEQGINIQQFLPAPAGDEGYVHVQAGRALGRLEPAFALYGIYAWRPLRLESTVTGEVRDIVAHLVQADVQAGLGFGAGLQLGVGFPVTLYQVPGESDEPIRLYRAQALGDLRLIPRWQIFSRDQGLGLALGATVTLPTGAEQNLQGDESVTVEPELALEWRVNERFRAALNAGYQVRGLEDLDAVDLGNEVTYGLGAAFAAVPGRLTLLAEIYGKVAADARTQLETEAMPSELNLAARLHFGKRHTLTLGAGPGLVRGYGTPVVRAYLGYTLTPTRGEKAPPRDSDGDGLIDRKDRCPKEPEDFDQFKDEDGCPEPDNDGDGLLDAVDRCPNEAEDRDGQEDQDGCPEADAPTAPAPSGDRDGDGLADAEDDCPDEPEDVDQVADTDGCPEADYDLDAILDEKDKCPMIPEVYNGLGDEDGCPDQGPAVRPVSDPRGGIEQIWVFFPFDSAALRPEAKELLDRLVRILKENPQITLLRVGGHADATGDIAYNQALSERRMAAVRNYLISQGIDAKRLITRAYGEERPIAPNGSEEGRAINRRVQFTILEIDGKAPERSVLPNEHDANLPAAEPQR